MGFEDINKEFERVQQEAHERGEEQSLRYYEEVVKHEVEEWGNLIESAETPEERSKIVEAIVLTNWVERNIEGREKWLQNLPEGFADIEAGRKAIEGAKSSIKETKSLVNEVRARYGLPPKYSVSE